AEARDVFPKEFDDRTFEPSVAEADARGKLTRLLRTGARVRRMLKEREARLLPQTMPQPERRVDGCGEHGRGHSLRQIVARHKLCGADLQVNLKARVRREQHDVVG